MKAKTTLSGRYDAGIAIALTGRETRMHLCCATAFAHTYDGEDEDEEQDHAEGLRCL